MKVARIINNELVAAKRPLVMYITGGGTSAIGDLLSNGGGSSYMMESVINYATNSTHQILGYVPKHYASNETTRALAMKAYLRALELSGNKNSVGLACSSKLYSEGERAGRQHEIHVAIQDNLNTWTFSTSISHLLNDREYQENVNATIILEALHRFIKKDTLNTIIDIENKYDVSINCAGYPELNKGMHTNTDIWWNDVKPVIFPGSFNPVHKNHINICNCVYQRTSRQPWLELSIKNTDKPTMDAISLLERIRGIKAVSKNNHIAGYIVTDKSLFIDKAQLYQDPTFVVGSDTINRVFDPKYYTDAAQYLARKELKFIVFQRKGFPVINEVKNNKNIEIISESEYLDDGTSSTLIRNSQ